MPRPEEDRVSGAHPRRLTRSVHDLALIKIGNMAYHLDSPARSQYIPLGVSARTMQVLATAKMLDLDQFQDPFMGYVLTSAGLTYYCERTGAAQRRYRVRVSRYQESELEDTLLDMRQAYDRVAELLSDQYHNHVLHAQYERA